MSDRIELYDHLMASELELTESAAEWHMEYVTGCSPCLPVSGDLIAQMRGSR